MPEEYAARAKELGIPMITFTEHGNLYTMFDSRDAADKVGVKSAPGIEFYQARKTRFDRDPDELSGKARSEWDQRGPHHLTVVAVNDTGVKNLIKLSSRAFQEGYLARKARVDFDLLSEHSEGLVCLSGCLSGKIQQALLRDDYNQAVEDAGRLRDIFGQDNFFIEMMNHGIDEEIQVRDDLIRLAKEMNVPMVGTCDSHYTLQCEHESHDHSLCVSTGALKADENRFRFPGDQFYLKSYDEMCQIFPEEWVKNSMLVYEKHEITSLTHGTHYPVFPIPEGKTSIEYFKDLIEEGAQLRFGDGWQNDSRITERIDKEFNAIIQQGFENYFFIVSDLMVESKKRGILCGPGRGSAAGCLLAYLLFITEVDPIQWDLSFERFMVYKKPEYTINFPEL